jgi:hypothetical protein
MTQKQVAAETSTPDDIVVRFVPTPDDIVDEMSKLAKIGKDDVVYDLGCGDAVMLIRPIHALAMGSAAQAQDEKLRDVKGTIRQLDLKVGAITLRPLLADKNQAFSLAAKDVPVADWLGQPIKLGDLREDLRVTAKVRNDAEIVALRLDGPFQYGAIKKVDAAARTILYKDVFADKTVTITADAKIMVAGKEGAFEQLKAGDPVQILHALDKKTIQLVQIGKGTNIRDPYLRIVKHFGILAEIDHGKRNVKIFVQSTDAGTIRTYDVAADAFLRVQYHLKPVGEVGFDQFAKWIKVHYTVDRDTERIIHMDADLPVMIRRKVLKAEADRIAVEDDLKERTLQLARDVQVLTPRGDGKLQEIVAGRIVNVALTLDRERVRVLYLWDK